MLDDGLGLVCVICACAYGMKAHVCLSVNVWFLSTMINVEVVSGDGSILMRTKFSTWYLVRCALGNAYIKGQRDTCVIERMKMCDYPKSEAYSEFIGFHNFRGGYIIWPKKVEVRR